MRQEEKRQRAEQSGGAAKPSRKQAVGKQERLPDGAKFEVVYDSGKTQWTGTLTVGGNVFSGSAGALFTLLNRLDRQYRLYARGTAPGNPRIGRRESRSRATTRRVALRRVAALLLSFNLTACGWRT